MQPLLFILKNNEEYSLKQVEKILSDQLSLTNEEKTRLLPSGKTTYFYNRLCWAKTSLQKAELVQQTNLRLFKITKKGSQVLKENPTIITIRYLKQFPPFKQFRLGKSAKPFNKK